jgi:uncharacterized membrane protein YeaQ/YmgE (transglycosylase-associated protein family)
MKTELKNTATNIGLYLLATLSLWSICVYATDNLEIIVNYWVSLLITPLTIIGFGVASCLSSKKALGGYISFKQAFTAYFITIIIGLIGSAVVSYLIFNVIDPDAGKEIFEIVIEKTIQTMERFGAPQEVIAEQVTALQEQMNYKMKNLLLQNLQGVILFSIIGLIVAAVTKKNKQ